MSDITVSKDWVTGAGFRAVVVMTDRGYHCGYVGVPQGHPLHGCGYTETCEALQTPPEGTPVGKRGVLALLCASLDENRMRTPEIVFDVHGGLTYSKASADYPAPNDGLWWFGYDCGHHGDSPNEEELAKQEARYPDMPFMWSRGHGEFRDLDYCVAECESLAHQIATLTRGAA